MKAKNWLDKETVFLILAILGAIFYFPIGVPTWIGLVGNVLLCTAGIGEIIVLLEDRKKQKMRLASSPKEKGSE